MAHVQARGRPVRIGFIFILMHPALAHTWRASYVLDGWDWGLLGLMLGLSTFHFLASIVGHAAVLPCFKK